MTAPKLGRDPGRWVNLSPAAKNEVGLLICKEIEQGLGFESACWACEIDPDDIDRAMREMPRLKQAVKKAFAAVEKQLLVKMKEGGPEAKLALEILERTNPAWQKKVGRTLAQQLDVACEELKKVLDEDNYKTVLDVLSRHA